MDKKYYYYYDGEISTMNEIAIRNNGYDEELSEESSRNI